MPKSFQLNYKLSSADLQSCLLSVFDMLCGSLWVLGVWMARKILVMIDHAVFSPVQD